jgi:hypothetical protein
MSQEKERRSRTLSFPPPDSISSLQYLSPSTGGSARTDANLAGITREEGGGEASAFL